MLYRYSEIFRTMLFLADLAWVALAWGAAYWIRFHSALPVEDPYKPEHYVWGLAVALPATLLRFRSHGLYQPQRTGSLLRESGGVIAALGFTLMVLLAASEALRFFSLSRLFLAFFLVLASASVIGFRLAGRGALRAARRRGYNLRYVLVIGAGDVARETIASIHGHPEAGLRVVGLLSGDPTLFGRSIEGVRVLGDYSAVKSVLDRQRIDQVVFALPREDAGLLEKILSDLDDEVVTVRMIPDLLHVMTLRSSVEELDGMPVINLRESPLVGWAAAGKRAFDVVVSAVALILASPFLAALALAIRATSGGPVLFRQERMGLDGSVFSMLKFRTMAADAESASGPVWTTADDPRRTGLGAFLRRTSLDELPQLWNVLRGDMSLVGPRPERPVFIAQFRREIPGYMLRHKVRAGLTGWAQVHGWRGNTSLHERVEHDIYYIQNWSFGLDLRILLMTVWRGFRNAY
jgi:Undecaprenyl-phosphate glucose phosphotransferase